MKPEYDPNIWLGFFLFGTTQKSPAVYITKNGDIDSPVAVISLGEDVTMETAIREAKKITRRHEYAERSRITVPLTHSNLPGFEGFPRWVFAMTCYPLNLRKPSLTVRGKGFFPSLYSRELFARMLAQIDGLRLPPCESR